MSLRTDRKPFRFWCQHVLPLVYDDTLSYYELLCKVVKYINNLLEDMNELTAEFNALKALFEELKKYVDSYFDNLDVQEYINNKLDEMAEDGTLAKIISEYVGAFTLYDSAHISPIANLPEDFEDSIPDWENWGASAIYALFDELVNDNSSNFSITTYGSLSTGEALKYYTLTPSSTLHTHTYSGTPTGYRDYTYFNQTENTIIIIAGIHGDEKLSVYNTYQMIKEILTSDDEWCRYVRGNIRVVIIPCGNPYGLNNNTRNNGNDVNINRNFPTDTWDSITDADKGSSAGSETETQFIMSVVNDYFTITGRNGTVVINAHDFYTEDADSTGYSPYNMWFVTGWYELSTPYLKTCTNILNKIKANYPEYVRNDRAIKFQIGFSGGNVCEYCTDNGIKNTNLWEIRAFVDNANRYSKEAAIIGWWQYSSALIGVAIDSCGVSGRNILITELAYIGCSESSTLEEIVTNMPLGSKLVINVATSSNLQQYLPATPGGSKYQGILEIQYSPNTRTVPYATLKYQMVGSSAGYLWVTTCNINGEVQSWKFIELDRPVLTNLYSTFDAETHNLASILESMYSVNSNIAVLNVEEDYTISSDLPISYGELDIFKSDSRYNMLMFNTSHMYVGCAYRARSTGTITYSDWIEITESSGSATNDNDISLTGYSSLLTLASDCLSNELYTFVGAFTTDCESLWEYINDALIGSGYVELPKANSMLHGYVSATNNLFSIYIDTPDGSYVFGGTTSSLTYIRELAG